MKKTIKITVTSGALLIFSIIGIICVYFFNNGIKHYSNYFISKESIDNIIKNKKEVKDELISGIKFDGQILIYDKTDNTYYCSIPLNKKYINPRVKYFSKDKTVKIKFLDFITKNNIKNDLPIELLAYNDKTYKKYYIKCTTLPVINIEVEDNFVKLKDSKDVYEANFYIFDNNSGKTIKSKTNIHLRGNVSISYPKKGFKLNLYKLSQGNHKRKNKISLLGMRKDDDWVLYAGYADIDKIRNVFSTNLWYDSCAKNNSFNIINGTQYKFTELFINNKYWGLYALGYPVDNKQLKLKRDKKGEFKEFLFKTGNELKSKIKDENKAWEKYNLIHENIKYAESPDKIYPIIDKSIFDFYLFNNLIQNVDVDEKNNYFSAIKNNGTNFALILTPWDLDDTWGEVNWEQVQKLKKISSPPYYLNPDYNNNFDFMAINRLKDLKDKNIDYIVVKRYQTLRKTYWSKENIGIVLDKYSNEIHNSGAFKRDWARWRKGESVRAEDLSHFKKYVFKRLEYMDIWVQNKHKVINF